MSLSKEIMSKYDVKLVDGWLPPSGEDLRPLIAMPNIPRPLHGVNPRTLLGASTWNHMRKYCYAKANDTCEICGCRPENLRHRHCLERGTEVLTSAGWKRIELVTKEDTVAGFSPETETVIWEKPTSTTAHFERNIIRFKRANGRGFSVGVSSGHRMLLQDGRTKEYKTIAAKDVQVGRWENIPASGRGEGDDKLSANERLLIAAQADGTIQKHNRSSYCVIRVKQRRKVKRLKQLARESSFVTHESYYETKSHGTYFRLGFTIPYTGKNFFDTFGSPKMSYTKATEFIEELVKWDGWEGERNGQPGRCYYSSERSNIDFVQAVCSQAGLGTHLTTSHRKARDFGDHVSDNTKPSYNLEIKKTAFHGMQTMQKSEEEYNDYVFCITVPSSYFIARTKGGDVFVTGNCHEVYEIDYVHGTAKFVRGFCVCSLDHLACIHTGRALTLWKHRNPLYPTEFLLQGAEHAFKIISEYNKDNPGADLRAYSTFLDYLKHEELREPMEKLIEKYDTKFYTEVENMVEWGDWKLIIGNREYPTPYADKDAWRASMEEKEANDTARLLQRNMDKIFSGEIYDELDKILKEENEQSD